MKPKGGGIKETIWSRELLIFKFGLKPTIVVEGKTVSKIKAYITSPSERGRNQKNFNIL